MGGRWRRTFVLLTAIAAVLALSAGAGLAQDNDDVYPPPPAPDASIEIEKDAIAPGDIQRIFGEGFQPGSEVSITVTIVGVGTLHFTATVDAAGEWTLEFRVPDDVRDGRAEVVVRGVDAGAERTVVLRDSFVVDSSLPITGEGISRMVLAAGFLLLLGSALVAYARQRRRVGAA